MKVFRDIPFKIGFFSIMGVAVILFFSMTQFRMVHDGFLIDFKFAPTGINLLFGIKYDNVMILKGQPVMWVIAVFAFLSSIISFLKLKMKHVIISILGIISVILLVAQITILESNAMGEFKPSSVYFLIIALAIIGSIFSWSHRNSIPINNKEIDTDKNTQLPMLIKISSWVWLVIGGISFVSSIIVLFIPNLPSWMAIIGLVLYGSIFYFMGWKTLRGEVKDLTANAIISILYGGLSLSYTIYSSSWPLLLPNLLFIITGIFAFIKRDEYKEVVRKRSLK